MAPMPSIRAQRYSKAGEGSPSSLCSAVDPVTQSSMKTGLAALLARLIVTDQGHDPVCRAAAAHIFLQPFSSRPLPPTRPTPPRKPIRACYFGARFAPLALRIHYISSSALLSFHYATSLPFSPSLYYDLLLCDLPEETVETTVQCDSGLLSRYQRPSMT